MAGFEVIGVDSEPQPNYPFNFILGDALEVDLSGYDVIAASPPCQRWSTATPPGRRGSHPDLVGPIRERLKAAIGMPNGPAGYIIENVPGAPLENPVTICGDTLRCGVRRHRIFESDLPIVGTPCWHDRPEPPVPVYGMSGQYRAGRTVPTVDEAREAMGIGWMPWPSLTQAIPPAYTHWIGIQVMALLCQRGRDAIGLDQVATVTTESPVSAGLRHCHCGAQLARPRTGRWPTHCSQACRQAAYRARQK